MAEVITVGCKLPSGLNLGADYGGIVLNGYHHPDAKFGFGITMGVDKAMFDKWCDDVAGPNVPERSKHPAVVRKLVFGFAKTEMVMDAAREMAAEKTGFEGMDPDNPDPQAQPTDAQRIENSKIKRGA